MPSRNLCILPLFPFSAAYCLSFLPPISALFSLPFSPTSAMPPDKRKFTPSDFYRIQWTYKEHISTSPAADSPQTSDSHHNDKDSLPDLLRRISEGTKDEKVRKAISAFHQDQGAEHLSCEEPRTPQLEESKHHDCNPLGCNLIRGETDSMSPVDNEEISKTDTRREKARKTRRNAIIKFEEIRRNAQCPATYSEGSYSSSNCSSS
jgi:hypothetical protein